MDGKKDGYSLSRQWFEFTFETEEMITPTHTALYFWIVELNNRLQWKPVIGLPTGYSMQAIGLKTYRSYKKTFDDLIRWGFIELKAKSHNQHTCNQIALVLKSKAQSKAKQKQSSDSKTVKTIQTGKNIPQFEKYINYQKPKNDRIYRE